MFPADLARFAIETFGLVSQDAQAYAVLGSLAVYFAGVIALAGAGVWVWEKMNG